MPDLEILIALAAGAALILLGNYLNRVAARRHHLHLSQPLHREGAPLAGHAAPDTSHTPRP